MAAIKRPTDAQVENARKRLQIVMSHTFNLMRKYIIRYSQLRQYFVKKASIFGMNERQMEAFLDNQGVKEFNKAKVNLITKDTASAFIKEEKEIKDRLITAFKNYKESNVIKNREQIIDYMSKFANNAKTFADAIKNARTPQQKAQIYNFARILAKPSENEDNTDFEVLGSIENKIDPYRPKDILTLIKVLEAYNEELKKHYMIFYKIKPTTPDIPTSDIIPESNKMSEDVKKLIEEELKVLNGKKMVRN